MRLVENIADDGALERVGDVGGFVGEGAGAKFILGDGGIVPVGIVE